MKKPYKCMRCKKLFPYEERGIYKRQLYNVTTEESICPFCGSWEISACHVTGPENKYLGCDVVKDQRYYNL